MFVFELATSGLGLQFHVYEIAMLKWLIRSSGICLLLSITLSFPVLNSQGQQRGRSGSSEITFVGKEGTRWREKREVPLPVIIGQGAKEEPQIGAFDLREDAIGPMTKMGPSTTRPGCAYSSGFLAGVSKVFVGDRALYERGRYQYTEKDYASALASFQELLGNYTESLWRASSLYWIGEIKYQQDLDEEAFSAFLKAAKEDPAGEFAPFALYSCGWIRLKMGDFEEGQAYFHRVQQSHPGQPIAESSLFWSSYCLYTSGRYDEALLEIKALLDAYPKGKWRAEAEYLRGVAFFRLQKTKEAAELFRGFLGQFPRNSLEESARYVLAWSLVSLRQYAEGRKAFEEILMAYPGTRLSDPIFWGILRTYLGEEDVDKAIDFEQRFLVHFLPSPWIEQCLFDIGQFQFQKRNYAAAMATFGKFLRTYPESELQDWVQFMTGECLFNQKDYSGAILIYGQMLEKKNLRLESMVLSRLGYAEFYMKNHGEALRYWDRLITEFPSVPERSEILYWMAESALTTKDYRRGVECIEKLKGDPELYPKGLNSLGWYHYQRGEWKQANQYFVKLVGEFPHFPSVSSVILLVAQCYLNQDDYPNAKKVLMGLESVPVGTGDKEKEEREKAFYLIGWICYRQEEFEEAIRHFERLTETNPSSPYRDESRYWIGWSYFRRKAYPAAIEQFQRLLQSNPESSFVPASLLKIGDSNYNLKRYTAAVLNYSSLVKDFPKSKEAPEADYGILLCLQQEKKYDAFVSRVATFLKKYPRHALAGQALVDLGSYYEQHGSREKALKSYRELVQQGSHSELSEQAQFRIVLLFKAEKKWNEVFEEVERFLKLYPKSVRTAEVQVEAGELYLLLKDFTKAVERFERALQAHPQNTEMKKIYVGLGEGYRSLGKLDQAEKAFRDLIARFPNDDIAYEGQLKLGLLLLNQKKSGDATAAFSAAGRSPEERVASQAQFKLGEAYQEMGSRDQAIVQFSKIVYLYPHLAELAEEALLKLGTLYLQEKKVFEAKQAYRKLLEKTKREDRRERAKKALDQIEKGSIR
jgi:TolA-binding protein